MNAQEVRGYEEGMDFNIWIILIPGLLLAAVSGFWLGSKPWRDMRKNPDLKEQMRLPFQERWRYGKMAQSQQPIADIEESRRAENAARLALRWNRTAISPRLLLLVIGTMVVNVGLRLAQSKPDSVGLILVVLLVGTFGLSYLWMRRAETRIHRTAEINGWNLPE